MLTVIGFQPTEHVVYEGDDFVPLKFSFPDTIHALPLYWRTGDFKRQLLEIGLEPNSGAICKITVTGIGELSDTADVIPAESTSIATGVPICDISRWDAEATEYADRFRDEVRPFTVFLRSHNVMIAFGSSVSAERVCSVGSVEFGLRDDVLSYISFSDLSSQSIERILERGNLHTT